MGTITIKNLSTLMDADAVYRVAEYILGGWYTACYDADGNRILHIVKRGNTYTVTDAEE